MRRITVSPARSSRPIALASQRQKLVDERVRYPDGEWRVVRARKVEGSWGERRRRREGTDAEAWMEEGREDVLRRRGEGG